MNNTLILIYKSEYKAQNNSRTSSIINSIKTSKWGNIKKISNVTGKILFNKTTASVLGLIASSIMLETIAPATAPFMFVSAAAMATSIVAKAIIECSTYSQDTSSYTRK
ncbi:MAG TPA: hypothetical protein LFW11_06160 [Rickettsia endosymbiont of Proechinophthirus fluctus]|uniref:hypothetical protein n=1 Tax=Rickettsia endosymbiont of Proechinophthirus fluctus TaxID=1462733 RepID=UPI0018AD5E33|nr:hypothetical protein [Rickettsia endosymbiont of Proechinophthirus fluctus]HJD54890.1 hypothetical protein [Rickettsia endosymbiont of Proechinophthirus fluctus]